MNISFSSRSQREQRLLVGCAIFVSVFCLWWAIDTILSNYNALDTKIAVNQEELKKIDLLRSQHMETKRQLDAVKKKIKQMPRDFSVISYIEKLADEENIRENIGSQKPKKPSLNDNYEENSVEIQMNNIKLSKLVNFIHKIENSGHLLKVKRLRMKTRYDDRDLLSVTMMVTTYKEKK